MGMALHWSPRSPFVRKVMITLHEVGLAGQVALRRSVVALHLPPNPDVLADNPLGKIPVLVTEDGIALFDSRVICEYLDMQVAGGLFPIDPHARFRQLGWQALGDGLLDILLLWRTELSRDTAPWDAITQGWRIKVGAAMDSLERQADDLAAAPFGIGQIAILCALGQLDFRWSDAGWRRHFPRLAGLEAQWQTRPSVARTAVMDDGPEGGDITVGQLVFQTRKG